MIDSSVKLLCTRKSGTLSRLIRRLKEFGLQYQHHDIESSDDYSEISVTCIGDLPLLESELRDSLMTLPEVINILEFSIKGNHLKPQIPSVKQPQNKESVANKLDVSFEITPNVIKLTERRLTKIIGPVAPFLVQKALKTSQNVGELYLLLAKELNDDERAVFLSIIAF